MLQRGGFSRGARPVFARGLVVPATDGGVVRSDSPSFEDGGVWDNLGPGVDTVADDDASGANG